MSTMRPPSVVSDASLAGMASAAGGFLVLLAGIVLAGWALHIPILASSFPGLATMKANTAVAFTLVGLGLLRRAWSDTPFYGAAVVIISLLTGAEYLLHADFGIDQLLFSDPVSTLDPGRMSQITCVGFLLLGLSLLLVNSRSSRLRRLSRGLALLTGILGSIALLGYSYDTQALYRVRPYTSVSLQTAFAFVIAATGVQCVHPQEGMVRLVHADTAGGAMLRQLLPAALLIPYVLGFVGWSGHKYLGWELGFSLALVIAATMLCLIAIMLRNAHHLEREDMALRELNRTLEDRIRARTADLDEQIRERERVQEIVDAQRAHMIAASKLTSLGEMAGGLAHEINSPLNIIQARASDLQEIAEQVSPVDARQVLKATNSILRTAERIMAIVRGLRTFARDGRTDPFEAVPVAALLEDTLALCHERFSAHGIKLEVCEVPPHWTVECQRVQVSQVLLNLLNNAFDAVQRLPERWVRVAVEQQGEQIMLSVTDSGRGIPKEIADKAMQPFFTTKPAGKGTGLGLSISNAIAETHHGQLRIARSGPNTQITLSIPIRQAPAPGEAHERFPQENTAVRGR